MPYTYSPKFTIGCDPEVFVTNRGRPASAYGLLQGTKESPFKTRGGAYQVDGMAAEFNTDPVPLRDRWNYRVDEHFNQWNRLITQQIKTIRESLPDGHGIRIAPTMEFGKEFLDTQPDAAKELGCDPDYNAYTLKENPRPDGERTFRTGAGHIHIGWGADIPPLNEEHMEICANFVKMLDATVGMFMAFVDRDPKRRELYGKAGAFRPKPYGVEYRTPSNVWITNRDMRRCVWVLVQDAIDQMTKGNNPCDATGFTRIDDAINEGRWQVALLAADRAFYRDQVRKNPWGNQGYIRPAFFQRVVDRINKEYGTDAQ
jgi:hypothetical protein